MTVHSIPQDFYVYTHHRATTGGIFYVGKGYGRRAWSRENRNKHWHAVVAKDGYTVRIAADGLSDWYALELEQDLVALYGRKDIGYGSLVNKTDGGDGIVGRVITEEVKLKYKWSDARKKAFSDNHFSKTKLVNYAVGARAGINQPGVKARHKKAVQQVFNIPVLRCEDSKVFASLTEALECLVTEGHVNPSHQNISAVCRGKKTSAYGYSWRYASDEEHAKFANAIAVQKSLKAAYVTRHSRPIKCVETGVIFEQTEYARQWCQTLGHPRAASPNIRAAANGSRKHAYGYSWMYV